MANLLAPVTQRREQLTLEPTIIGERKATKIIGLLAMTQSRRLGDVGGSDPILDAIRQSQVKLSDRE